MQDSFVGDVGDFGKYGLLRTLVGEFPEATPRLSLEVVWYRNPDDVGSPNDGKQRSYIDQPRKFAECDLQLFDFLKQLDSRSSRSLIDIERSGILGPEARFLPWPGQHSSDVVFLDPDKGLAFTPRQHSSEHAYLPDVEIRPDQSVVIYQSFGRQTTHPAQMATWSHSVAGLLPHHEAPHILRYWPQPPRAFIVVPSVRHSGLIADRLDALLNGPWHRHFTLFCRKSPRRNRSAD
jgi:hypothetical protein